MLIYNRSRFLTKITQGWDIKTGVVGFCLGAGFTTSDPLRRHLDSPIHNLFNNSTQYNKSSTAALLDMSTTSMSIIFATTATTQKSSSTISTPLDGLTTSASTAPGWSLWSPLLSYFFNQGLNQQWHSVSCSLPLARSLNTSGFLQFPCPHSRDNTDSNWYISGH